MDVHQDRAVRLNWITVNVPTIIAIAAGIMAGTWAWAELTSRIATIESAREMRSQANDQKFAEINTSIAGLRQAVTPMDNLSYRVGVLEGSLGETNDRIDRLSETIISSLELIRRDVNGLSTRVEVLSQKIDSMNDDRREAGRESRSPP
ncbi:hypothetical protein [Pararhizobium haloflavum]|uniref:hypothetical protein n=1 Tax=Pararhizobium haloflavum TaxID=2037914 RepID=UPI000C1A4481|nr:hypothetical protein [Pararhizobium haloflavum]